MIPPRITAVITSYNYGHFVCEAIESVLAQGPPPAELEVVVVDDGSTDDTPERVRRFEDRITYIRKPNGGQASALNTGFAHAHADLVALLDADDVWLPGKLHRVMASFDEHPEAVMVQHTRVVSSREALREEVEANFPELSGDFPLLPRDLLLCATMATSGLAFRKSRLGSLLPIPEILTGHADSYLSAFAVLQAPIVSLNEPLTRYRIHGGNLYSFASADEKRAERRLLQMETFVRVLERQMSAVREQYRGDGLEGYLDRFRLIAQSHRFHTKGAGRLEFFTYLRKHRKVYRPLWTRRYSAYRVALEWLALALGYRAFSSLRTRSAQAGLQRLREDLFPAHVREAAFS